MINKIPILFVFNIWNIKKSANKSIHSMSLGSHFSWLHQHFFLETHVMPY